MSIDEYIDELRRRADASFPWNLDYMGTVNEIADTLEKILDEQRREAESIERIVRDAIIDYQEMYAHAPNDDAERDLKDRAKRGNSWLAAHGYEPEKITWSKEETPCL